MSVSYREAKKYLGKIVKANCQGGVCHVGKVQKVQGDGIWLDRESARHTASDSERLDVQTADGMARVEGESVFLPFLFLPLVTLFSLSPYRFGGYGRGGYGRGYGYGAPYGFGGFGGGYGYGRGFRGRGGRGGGKGRGFGPYRPW